MKSENNFLGKIVNILIYSAIFIASLARPTDPDLGWHLKYGQYFFEHFRILKENTFSALMPSYQWNNSSWLTDLISYQAYHHLGFLGLSFLAAGVITLTFVFIGKAAKLNLFEKSIIFPVILFFVSPVNNISFRGQLVSLLLLAVMYYLLSLYSKKNRKIIFALIPLFTLWSNLHGEFILGLAIFYIWAFVYLAKEIYLNYGRRIKELVSAERFLLIALLGSAVAAVVNPFGIGVYIETLGHFNSSTHSFITEYQPLSDFSPVWWHQMITGSAMAIGLLMLGTGRKTLDKAPLYMPSILLFVLTFWIRRYAWPFYYSSIFLLSPVVNFFKPETEKYAQNVAFFISALFLLVSIGINYPFKNVSQMNWKVYCTETVNCSSSAAQSVIDNNLTKKKLLTIYDYGGWLIWNYPKIKPTIDGRMDVWVDKSGYSAFKYYYPIEQNMVGIDSTSYNAVLTSHRKPIYKELVNLTNQGKWTLLHDDDYAAVFVRNQSSSENN